MSSVTQRIKQIKQPRGGYIPLKEFSVIKMNDNSILCEAESIHSSLIGLAVDYLARWINHPQKEKVFAVSLLGARRIGEERFAKEYLKKITGLDDESIICACRLAGYDVVVRKDVNRYRPVEKIVPDEATITNIRVMVNRCMHFFQIYGPIVKEGFTFEGGYTQQVTTGDGDFLTKDTLWEIKVSKNKPISQHTLQPLVYYLMGIHSIHPEFQTVTRIGIFNPRLNHVYTQDLSLIDEEIIHKVSEHVIGYR